MISTSHYILDDGIPNMLLRIIQDLTSEVLTHVGALYKASEAVALVDMLWSFAHVSISMFSLSGFDFVC